MVMTVEEGFTLFHKRLTPTMTESNAAKLHRSSIQASLVQNFEMKSFFRTGSFGNGTSIRNYSDVDYFAEIPTQFLKQNSQSSLRAIRLALIKRFPNTKVSVRTPAIFIPFGISECESTEVVPADFLGKDEDGFRIYEIPNGDRGWVRSSPDAHNAFVSYVNDKLNKKVKPLIRFIKAWKYFRNVPISSFYLEIRVAQYALEQETIIYSIDIRDLFKYLLDIQLAAIQDPMKISGYIYPCSTDAKKQEALFKLRTAFTRAENALEAETKENYRAAFYCWNLLYNGKFPAYR